MQAPHKIDLISMRTRLQASLLLFGLLLIFYPSFISGKESVPQFKLEIVNVYPHDCHAFTQGLVIRNQVLYESTGLYGASSLRRVDLATGEVLHMIKLPFDVFGEGLAFLDNRLIQLTWREKKAFVYDANTFKLIKAFPYQGEGWGLCSDGTYFYMSNGTDTITVRDSHSFAIVNQYQVQDGKHSYNYLNDLESVGESIYANQWGKDEIIQFNKKTGIVTGIIKVGHLLSSKESQKISSEDVLNGITYSPDRQTFFLTGKKWPWLFEVRFIPQEN